jgi:arogenate dehydrogenase (NADP+)
MKTIGIVGLGLIGGSLGLDLRSQGYEIIGVSRKQQTCQRALERGAVDTVTTQLAALQAAELIFLCTPLGVMQETVREMLPYLDEDTILTDVGSVKGWVVQTIAPLWQNFVGGHPMAGTAESGIEAAQFNLFVGAPYVLTPIESTPIDAVQQVEQVVQPLGIRLYRCQPETHDQAVAWISHLPVIVSASLIHACLDAPDTTVLDLAKQLASSGFKDTSRVGGGNPELGVMMARYNREALLKTLTQYRKSLDHLEQLIQQEAWQDLAQELTETQLSRPDFIK